MDRYLKKTNKHSIWNAQVIYCYYLHFTQLCFNAVQKCSEDVVA